MNSIIEHSVILSFPVIADGCTVSKVFPNRKLSDDRDCSGNVVRKRKKGNVLPGRSAPPFHTHTHVLPSPDLLWVNHTFPRDAKGSSSTLRP